VKETTVERAGKESACGKKTRLNGTENFSGVCGKSKGRLFPACTKWKNFQENVTCLVRGGRVRETMTGGTYAGLADELFFF
jgi:hypothetical protein